MEFLLVSPDLNSISHVFMLCQKMPSRILFIADTRCLTSIVSIASVCNIDENQTARQRLVSARTNAYSKIRSQWCGNSMHLQSDVFVMGGGRKTCVFRVVQKRERRNDVVDLFMLYLIHVPYEQTFGWTQNFSMNGMHCEYIIMYTGWSFNEKFVTLNLV